MRGKHKYISQTSLLSILSLLSIILIILGNTAPVLAEQLERLNEVTVQAEIRTKPVWSTDSQLIAIGVGVDPNIAKMKVLVFSADDLSILLESGVVEDEPNDISWNVDMDLLAVATDLGYARVYSLYEDLNEVWETNDLGSAISVAWSPNGEFLAVGEGPSSSMVYVFARGGELLWTVDTAWWPENIGWSPDCRYLAIADGAGNFYLADSNGNVVLDGVSLPSTMASLAWSPEGDVIALGDAFNPVIYLVTPKGEVLSTIQLPENTGNMVQSLDWSPDGKYLAAASGNHVLLIDTGSGSVLATYAVEPETTTIIGLAWSPSDNRLAFTTSDNRLAIIQVPGYQPEPQQITCAGTEATQSVPIEVTTVTTTVTETSTVTQTVTVTATPTGTGEVKTVTQTVEKLVTTTLVEEKPAEQTTPTTVTVTETTTITQTIGGEEQAPAGGFEELMQSQGKMLIAALVVGIIIGILLRGFK